MFSENGNTIFTDKEVILERWAEHFNNVVNRPSSINENTIDRLPQIECNVLYEISNRHGNQKSSSTTVIWKATGADAILVEFYKTGGWVYPWQIILQCCLAVS